jgi:Winged helix-turn-helix DNA-binding
MFPDAGTGSLTAAPAATAVFTAVLTEGPLSRVSLARRLGLSSAAVTKAARPLIDMGYLRELAATERTGPGAGRPASPLAVQADREFFVGVKITADELIGVVCDLCSQVRATAHRPLSAPDVEAVLTDLGQLVDGLAATGPAPAGWGWPSPATWTATAAWFATRRSCTGATCRCANARPGSPA